MERRGISGASFEAMPGVGGRGRTQCCRALQHPPGRGLWPWWVFSPNAQLSTLNALLAAAASAAEPVPTPSFRNQVQPILTKAGCNMGACHGAAAGKNGFYLSLRGYNDEADWQAITRSGGGRRIALADPGRSLLLLKATGTVPHKGGKRFDTGSPEYQTLADWIAGGAPRTPAG